MSVTLRRAALNALYLTATGVLAAPVTQPNRTPAVVPGRTTATAANPCNQTARADQAQDFLKTFIQHNLESIQLDARGSYEFNFGNLAPGTRPFQIRSLNGEHHMTLREGLHIPIGGQPGAATSPMSVDIADRNTILNIKTFSERDNTLSGSVVFQTKTVTNGRTEIRNAPLQLVLRGRSGDRTFEPLRLRIDKINYKSVDALNLNNRSEINFTGDCTLQQEMANTSGTRIGWNDRGCSYTLKWDTACHRFKLIPTIFTAPSANTNDAPQAH